MELASTEARRLDKFVCDHLQPDEAFLRQVRRAIDTVCEFLRATCFSDATCPIDPRPRVLKVVKGGSSGKGTALKTGSDADLVLFLSIFRGYTDQERDRKAIIKEIEQRLRECQQEKRLEVQFESSKWGNPRVLSFKLRSKDASVEDYIDFDVLPAFDALGHYSGRRPDPQVYLDLIRSSGGKGSQFSPCFTELQRDFVIDCPTKLKSLIRLVKHWYKQLPEESLPPKYGLELLAIYAWEKGSGQTAFNMAEGFRTVLWLLQQYRQLCIFWTRFYDFENKDLRRFLQSQLWKPRPIILDPADPTGIIGEGKRWDVFARHAADWAFRKCCRNFDGSLVKPWRVPAFDPGLALYATEAAELDEFIAGSIQPSKASLDQVRSLVDAVCTFLRDGCFKDAPRPWPRVMKIVKGGSLGNGSALKGGAEADLVLFLNTITDYAEQEREGERIVQKIKERLGQGGLQERTEVEIGPLRRRRSGHGLDFTVRSWKCGESVEFHVLPAFDALGQGAKGGMPDPQVYLDLIRSSGGRGGQFSPCFTELQRDFVIDRPPKLKSLIRLLKHWYKQFIYPRKSELQDGEYLPPGYALELLAVYAWEKGSGQTAFNMAEGFRTVLWLLQQYRQLCIFWTRFYGFENEELGRFLHSQLRKPRPVILDPADPTGNVGEGSRWDLLATEAEHCTRQRCCRDAGGAPAACWDVPAFDPGLALYATEAAELDEFIAGSIQPSKASLDQVRSLVDAVCTFLRDGCFKDAPRPWPRVMKIVKGGSLGNGSALKGGAEADLVLFLNTITDYAEQEREGERIVQKIKERLGQGGLQERTEVEIGPLRRRRSGHGLDFTVRSWKCGESVEFHVLPAFDALGQGAKGGMPDPQVYLDLIRSSGGRGGQFSPCFTELQRDFVIDRPPKLKSLIRLLKHWYKQFIYPRKSELQDGEYLPPGYALELLAVYAWEKGSGQTAFNMAEGFRTVLWLLQQYRQLCIFWTRFYGFENEELGRFLHSQLRKPRPVILDPADPTGNVGEGSRWDLLATEAEHCTRQRCCRDAGGAPAACWDVPLQVPMEKPSSVS